MRWAALSLAVAAAEANPGREASELGREATELGRKANQRQDVTNSPTYRTSGNTDLWDRRIQKAMTFVEQIEGGAGWSHLQKNYFLVPNAMFVAGCAAKDQFPDAPQPAEENRVTGINSRVDDYHTIEKYATYANEFKYNFGKKARKALDKEGMVRIDAAYKNGDSDVMGYWHEATKTVRMYCSKCMATHACRTNHGTGDYALIIDPAVIDKKDASTVVYQKYEIIVKFDSEGKKIAEYHKNWVEQSDIGHHVSI